MVDVMKGGFVSLKNKSFAVKRTLLFSLLFLIILTGGRLSFLKWQQIDEIPAVDEGVLDLSNIRFPFEQVMNINGEWKFFPNELVHPSNVDKLHSNNSFISLPSKWNRINRPNEEAVTFGTYYTKIILPKTVHDDTNSIFSFYLQDIYTAVDVFVNGNNIGHIGQVSNTKKDHVSNITPTSMDFTTKDYELDLVIHVSNLDFPLFSGVTQPIYFGTKHAIDVRSSLYENLQILAIIIIIVHIFYSFIFFRISQSIREIFFYMLLLLFLILTILFDNSYLISAIINLSFHTVFTIKIFSYMGASIAILLFFQEIFPKQMKGKLLHFLLYMNCFFILLLFLPFEYRAYVFYLSFISTNGTLAYISYTQLKEGFTNATYPLTMIFLIACTVSSVVWGTLFNFSSLNITYYPFEMLLILMAIAFFMVERANAYSKDTIRLSNELALANEMKDFFIASTTHELKNPLQSVITITENLLTKEYINQTAADQLRLVLTATNHMRITLNDFYDISLIQEGKISLAYKPVSLQAITKGIVHILSYSIDKDNVVITIDIPDNFPTVLADENRLTQIMFNLIHNAVKYTDQGTINIQAEIKNDIALISVSDTGIGIANELKETIFEPYVYNPSAAARGGTGVGLTVSKKLVELHGGKIFFESILDGGTTFSFTLPLSYDDIPPDNTRSAIWNNIVKSRTVQHAEDVSIKTAHTSILKNAKILVVDDDLLNIEVITNILASDYHITSVTNGSDALRLIEKESFDLLIIDVMMPNMSGFELTKKIRKFYSITELPILMFTARNLIEDIYTGFLVGANDYVTKPVNSLELTVRVQSLLSVKVSTEQRLHFEAAWLQAQIKPHFIFNTLNAIIALSYIDQDRMIHLIEQFSFYLRKSFAVVGTNDLIPLVDELELIKAYVDIQKERFPNKLNVHMQVENNSTIHLPPYSLLTIVENSIIHGILKKSGNGNVWIDGWTGSEQEVFFITVKDDGIGISSVELEKLKQLMFEDTSGIGLVNTNLRLEKSFGTSIDITSRQDIGTEVRFSIPIKKPPK